MCVIMVSYKGEMLSDHQLNQCWQQNPYGGGVMFIDNNQKLRFYKNLDRDKWRKELRNILKKYSKCGPVVAHVRGSALAGANLLNCHPFNIRDDLGFVHNGYITLRGGNFKDMNDTRTFNEKILKHLPDKFEDNQVIMDMIADIAGNDKIAMLRSDGTVYIINPTAWEEVDGVLVSNKLWQCVPVRDEEKEVKGRHQDATFRDDHCWMCSGRIRGAGDIFEYTIQGEKGKKTVQVCRDCHYGMC